MGTSTAQVKEMISVITGKSFVLADCTLGEEWAAWERCEPLNGVCGNGTRRRYKMELLPARNGGTCSKSESESEPCSNDCPHS